MTAGSILRLPLAQSAARVVATDKALVEPWVQAARLGRLDAWEALYRHFCAGVYRHLCYLTGDPQLAEDLAQDVFARAMASIATFAEDARFSTWLHGIAINVARMHWRRGDATRRAFGRLEDLRRQHDDDFQRPDGAHLRNRKMQVLYGVLATLPGHLREAFVLRDAEGLPVAEVAAQLGISPANVAVRAHRARLRIRDELERLGWLQEEGER